MRARLAEGSAAQLALYALPLLALSTPFFWLQFYGLLFATDVLGLAPATAGAILALVRMWDALSDPLVGHWSDRTSTRLGRRRPWMLTASPLLAASVALLWRAPVTSPPVTAAWWLGAALLFTTAFTAWVIPHQALGVEIARTPPARSRLFGARHATLMAGAFASFACTHRVVTSDAPRQTAADVAMLLALGALVLLPAPALVLRERTTLPAPATSLGGLPEVLLNPDARRLLGVWGLDQLGLAVQGIVVPYLAIHWLRRPDLVGVLPALFLVPSMLSIPIWIVLATRLGRTRAWRLSMVTSSIAFLPLAAVGRGQITLLAFLLTAAGAASGCTGAIGPAVLADVIDSDAARTGERREGIYTAAWLVVLKLAGALVALLTGLLLQAVGFSPTAEVQTPQVLFAIRGLLGVVPAVAVACGAFLLAGLRPAKEGGAVQPGAVGGAGPGPL